MINKCINYNLFKLYSLKLEHKAESILYNNMVIKI